MYSPYDEVKGLGAGAFNEIFAPANANVWASNNYNANPGNSIYYTTPTISGFSAALSYSFGENKTGPTGTPPNTDAGRTISMNARYASGPVDVALSHQQEKANGAAANVKFTQLNASYDLSVVKIRAAFGQVKNGTTGLFVPAVGTPPTVTPVAVNKSREFQVGVDVPLGNALTLSTGVASGKLTLASGGEIKSTGFGIAAKYAVSKRTLFYTGLLLAKNKGSGAQEVKTDVFAAGVQHQF